MYGSKKYVRLYREYLDSVSHSPVVKDRFMLVPDAKEIGYFCDPDSEYDNRKKYMDGEQPKN